MNLPTSEPLPEARTPRDSSSRTVQPKKGLVGGARARTEYAARVLDLGEAWARIGEWETNPALNSSTQHGKDGRGGGSSKNEKRLKVELPPLPKIGNINLYTPTTCCALGQETHSHHAVSSLTQTRCYPHPRLRSAHSWPPSSPVSDLPFKNPFGGLAPLTPPQELDSFEWSTLEPAPVSPRQQSLSSEQDNSRPEITAQQQSSTTGRPSTISLPGFVNMPDQNTSPSTWLERTVNTIGEQIPCFSSRSND